MRRVCFLLAAALLGCPTKVTAAESVGLPVESRIGLSVPLSFDVKGANISLLADLLQAATSTLYANAVASKIGTSLATHQAHIDAALNDTGQKGYLVRVEIERALNEAGMYDLVGDGVQLLGAGTSAEEVAIADAQLPKLLPERRSNHVVDGNKSFYLFITKEGSDWRIRSIRAETIRRAVVTSLSNEAILDFNEQSLSRALQDAIVRMENAAVDDAQKKELAEIRRNQEMQRAKFKQISSKLDAELERAKKAARIGSVLSTIGTTMTLAYQISALKAELGKDTPLEVDSVEMPKALAEVARKVEAEASSRAGKLHIEYSEIIKV